MRLLAGCDRVCAVSLSPFFLFFWACACTQADGLVLLLFFSRPVLSESKSVSASVLGVRCGSHKVAGPEPPRRRERAFPVLGSTFVAGTDQKLAPPGPRQLCLFRHTATCAPAGWAWRGPTCHQPSLSPCGERRKKNKKGSRWIECVYISALS